MATIKQISFNFFHFKCLNSNLTLNPLLLVSELYVQSLCYLVLPIDSFPVCSVHLFAFLAEKQKSMSKKKIQKERKKKKKLNPHSSWPPQMVEIQVRLEYQKLRSRYYPGFLVKICSSFFSCYSKMALF